MIYCLHVLSEFLPNHFRTYKPYFKTAGIWSPLGYLYNDLIGYFSENIKVLLWIHYFVISLCDLTGLYGTTTNNFEIFRGLLHLQL